MGPLLQVSTTATYFQENSLTEMVFCFLRRWAAVLHFYLNLVLGHIFTSTDKLALDYYRKL